MKGNSEEARALREYLKQVEAKLFEHYRNLLADNTLVTPEALKNAYLGLETDQHSLLELMDYHNHQLKNTLEWGTMKNYFTTQNLAIKNEWLDKVSNTGKLVLRHFL